MNTPGPTEQAMPRPCLASLPSKILQIATMHFSAGVNNGDYCTLIALCADGSVWEQYHSNGYSNVPTDMLWRELHEPNVKQKTIYHHHAT
jgi:hypothetical protein